VLFFWRLQRAIIYVLIFDCVNKCVIFLTIAKRYSVCVDIWLC
jgi:hypothetical protein